MADNIFFKQGKLASLPEALNSGQILFAINDNDNNTGSIYLDYKDGDIVRRAKLNADATKLTTPINLTIGNRTKDLNTDLGNISWTHDEIGANVSLSYTGGSTSGPTITSLINGVSDSFTFPSASSTVSGIVNTNTQTFGGDKTFNGITTFKNIIRMGNHNYTTTNTSYSSANNKIIFNYPKNTSSTTATYSYGTTSLNYINGTTFALSFNRYLHSPKTNSNYQNHRSIAVYNWANTYFSFSSTAFYANSNKNGVMRYYNSTVQRFQGKGYDSQEVIDLGIPARPWGNLYLSEGITMGNFKVWNNSMQNNNNAASCYKVSFPNITLYGGNSTADYDSIPIIYSKSILGTDSNVFYIYTSLVNYHSGSTSNTNTIMAYANYYFTTTYFGTEVSNSADLGATTQYWNRAYISTIYGDLYGNANTATALETPINFTIGNTSKEFNGSNNVSWSFTEIGSDISKFDWTPGTTAGPILNLTLNGTIKTAIIPSASETESGIITIGEQVFSGKKQFTNRVLIGEAINNSSVCQSYTDPGIYLHSSTLASDSSRFGEGYIGLTYTDADKYLFLEYKNHTNSSTTAGNIIKMDEAAFYPEHINKTLGKSDKRWDTTYADKFVGSQAEISETTRTNRLVITNTTSGVKHLQFSREGYNYIWAPKGGSIAFSPNERTLNAETTGATFVINYDNTILSPSHAILGSEKMGFNKVYAESYIVNNAVTLQYNTTNETLEFVFT